MKTNKKDSSEDNSTDSGHGSSKKVLLNWTFLPNLAKIWMLGQRNVLEIQLHAEGAADT